MFSSLTPHTANIETLGGIWTEWFLNAGHPLKDIYPLSCCLSLLFLLLECSKNKNVGFSLALRSSQEVFQKNIHGCKTPESRYFETSCVLHRGLNVSLTGTQSNRDWERQTDFMRSTHSTRDSNSYLLTHSSVGSFSPLQGPSLKIALGCYDPWGKSIFWMKETLVCFFTGFKSQMVAPDLENLNTVFFPLRSWLICGAFQFIISKWNTVMTITTFWFTF